MLVLHDGARHARCDPFVLRELFDLTTAEVDVAVLLSQGLPPDRIATLRGVATVTVRSQLHKLMVKTGTRRKTDLVRRLLAVPQSMEDG